MIAANLKATGSVETYGSVTCCGHHEGDTFIGEQGDICVVAAYVCGIENLQKGRHPIEEFEI